MRTIELFIYDVTSGAEYPDRIPVNREELEQILIQLGYKSTTIHKEIIKWTEPDKEKSE
jgi:hypothetical protein